MKKFNLLFICAALGFCSTLFAQTADRPWTLSLFGVKTEYMGDMRKFESPYTTSSVFDHTANTIFNFDKGMAHYGGGLQVSRYLSRFFDLGLYASYSSIGFDYYDEGTMTTRKFDVESLINANLNTRFKILGNDDYRVVPYISLGIGGLYYMNPTNANGDALFEEDGTKISESLEGLLTGGIGVEIKLTDLLSLRYQADLGWTTADRLDSYWVNSGNDWQLQHSLGLSFNFGKKQDADGDGVKDKKDLCPDTPAGVVVDKNGCPVDTDGDGVADYLDACPDVAGTVSGCPDADADGVADKDDQCPDTPAAVRVDANGCPVDSDKDGVADYLDKCPNTPANVKVDVNGCPLDTDKDGVADYLDKCPDTPADVKVDATGCPIVEVETIEADFAFATGRAAIRPNPNTKLDELAAKLKASNAKVSIVGFTDNAGEPKFNNQKLSEDRANAVKAYLVRKGVDANNVEAKGAGVSNTFDNATEEGRAKNRRVEVSFEVKK